MPLTGKFSVRAAFFGKVLALRVQEIDANGAVFYRDASLDDLADLGTFDLMADRVAVASEAVRPIDAKRGTNAR